MKLSLIFAAGALLVPACAPVSGADAYADASVASGQCFYSQDVDNFRIADRNTTYIHSSRGTVFRLAASAACFDPAGARTLTVEPYVSASHRICAGDQARTRLITYGSQPISCIARVDGPIRDSAVSGLPGGSGG